jgi:putative transposase
VKLEISVSEVVQVIKEIQDQPGKILEMVKTDMPKAVGGYLRDVMQIELTRFLGRQPYERVEEESNHRNGSYPRNFTLKGIGEVGVKVPRDRKGEYQTQVILKSKQYEDELRQDIAVMFLSGVSTRTLAMISHRLIGRKISSGEVSRCSQELVKAIESWRNRSLSLVRFKYLFCDGVYFEMRVARSIMRKYAICPICKAPIQVEYSNQALRLVLEAHIYYQDGQTWVHARHIATGSIVILEDENGNEI